MSIQSEREQQRQRDAEIAAQMNARIIPGRFYVATCIGGFRDVLSGVHVPGPKAQLDANRNVVALLWDECEPVQLPTHRTDFPISEKGVLLANDELVEVSFDRADEGNFCDGLNSALRTGVIREIEEIEMEARWPAAWKARFEKRVHVSAEKQRAKALADLFAAAAKAAPK